MSYGEDMEWTKVMNKRDKKKQHNNLPSSSTGSGGPQAQQGGSGGYTVCPGIPPEQSFLYEEKYFPTLQVGGTGQAVSCGDESDDSSPTDFNSKHGTHPTTSMKIQLEPVHQNPCLVSHQMLNYNRPFKVTKPSTVTNGVDYLVLVQQWPPTFARKNKRQNSNILQHMYTSWVLHGLWAMKMRDKVKNDEEGTNVGAHIKGSYDREPDFDLLEPLKEHWPALGEDSNLNHWRHEWLKHGGNYRFDAYLRTTLKLKNQYNIHTMLSRHSIVPGHRTEHRIQKLWTAKEFSDAITVELGGNSPRIERYFDGSDYIIEISIKLDLNLNPMDFKHKYMGSLQANHKLHYLEKC